MNETDKKVKRNRDSTLDKWVTKKPKIEYDYVILPNSIKNQYKSGDKYLSKWYLIETILSDKIEDFAELSDVLTALNKYFDHFNCKNLETVSDDFIKTTLPKMQKLALKLPQLFPDKIPILKRGMDDEVTFSREQIASLLCNGFFNTFPNSTKSKKLTNLNFLRLYETSRNNNIEKFKTILNYFEKITDILEGFITFKRKVLTKPPKWENSQKLLCELIVNEKGTIEESDGMLQVDFANKKIGGGVLGRGCVQEEIRFAVSTECIASKLIMEELDDNESIIIIGSQRFSKYKGYGDTYTFDGDFNDTTEKDEKGRLKNEIIAIDAYDFKYSNPKLQFTKKYIDREINKAYCGFMNETQKVDDRFIATGLWGCGVFLGDKELKSLLQIMAASEGHRKGMVFYTYGDDKFRDELKNIYEKLLEFKVTVGDLYKIIISKPKDKKVFQWIYEELKSIHFSRTKIEVKFEIKTEDKFERIDIKFEEFKLEK
eukprot:gene10710-3332_t